MPSSRSARSARTPSRGTKGPSGLRGVGGVEGGDRVLVSGAAGGVGTMVGQIAGLGGWRVVGTAGGQDKCAWLTRELGLDAAVDYKAGGVRRAIAAAAPN